MRKLSFFLLFFLLSTLCFFNLHLQQKKAATEILDMLILELRVLSNTIAKAASDLGTEVHQWASA